MKHVIVFIHIFSFVVGISTILLFTLAYFKNKNKALKLYIFFIIALTAILIQQTVSSYDLINRFNNIYIDTLMRIFSFAGSGLMIYSLTLFIHRFLDIGVSEKEKLIITVLACSPVPFFLLYYTAPNRFLVIIIANIIFYGVILYNLCLIIMKFNKINQSSVRNVIIVFLTITAIFFPYMIFDSIVEQIHSIRRYFPYGLASVAVFYLVWNALSLYYAIKLFYKKIEIDYSNKKAEKNAASIDFYYEKYNITNREREIVQLLMKGCSYKSIGEELVISLPTVKTHVSNIYQKVGVKNKVELINEFREYTSI